MWSVHLAMYTIMHTYKYTLCMYYNRHVYIIHDITMPKFTYCVRAHTCVCLCFVWMCMYMYVYMYVAACIYVCMYVCMYVPIIIHA